jgi:pilus assembly protein CpaD
MSMKPTPFALLCGALALTAGCASLPTEEVANLATQADQHKITVSEIAQQMSLPVRPDDASLSRDAQIGIDAFARAYVRQGHGAVYISTPSGGANSSAAARLAQEARMKLAASGVPYYAIVGSTYEATTADAPMMLRFVRFAAQAPECAPLYTQDLAHNPSNRPYESFGCSSQANLAAIISDPRDLIEPRLEDPRDPARRAHVLEAYRKGDQTHATRSNDERVQVSKAVE